MTQYMNLMYYASARKNQFQTSKCCFLTYLFPFKSGFTSVQTLRNKVDFWSFLGHNWLKSSFLLSVAMRRVGVMSPQSSEKGIPRERSLRWPILWRTYYIVHTGNIHQ